MDTNSTEKPPEPQNHNTDMTANTSGEEAGTQKNEKEET